MAKIEKSNFAIKNVKPDVLSPEDFVTSFDKAVEELKKLEMAQRGRRKVELKVNHSDPIELILAGDLHLGSFAASKEMCDDLKDYLLETPNAVLVLMGDEIEGFKARYASTNVLNTVPGLQTQLDYFYYSFFKPLSDAGKIAAVVSGHWGHEGWAHDDTTINIWANMIRHDETVPLIANGGVLEVTFSNRRSTEVQVFHNPPGTSQIDPVHGLRKAAQGQNPANRPGNYAAGHLHRAGVVSENYPGVPGTANYIQAGTAKSSTEGGNTDPFGEKLGLPLADPWLQGLVIRPPKGRKGWKGSRNEVEYPFITADQGQIALAAMELLNETESLGVTDEVLGEVYDQYPGPNVRYVPQRSIVTSSPADMARAYQRDLKSKHEEDKITQAGTRPLYQEVAYDIHTHLPITLYPVGNSRLGSFHEEYSPHAVEVFTESIAEDPYAVAIFLRNVLDVETSKRDDRLQVLQRYIDMVNLLDGRALGIMLDGNLGSKGWLKRLGDEWGLRPVAAGSLLSRQTGARLIHHMSVVNIAIGPNRGFNNKIHYPVQTPDRLLRHGSFSSTKGIKRMYDLYAADRPAVVMGGHMPVSGVGQFFDRSNQYIINPAMVSPGWFSKFTDTTGTRWKGGQPGQAVIMIPGQDQSEALMFPTATMDQTEDLSKALTLYYGANLIGVRDELMRA